MVPFKKSIRPEERKVQVKFGYWLLTEQGGEIYMPKVRGFTNNQKINQQQDMLVEELDVLLCRNHLSKKDIAEFVDITPAAISYQFRSKSISMPVLMAIVTLTNADGELVKKMLSIKGVRVRA